MFLAEEEFYSKEEQPRKGKVKVVDSLMGTGKTNYAIDKIRNDRENNYIYITPYLGEIKRVKKEVSKSVSMYEPKYKGRSKREDLHKLLSSGKNVCSTHALFQRSNEITREALRANNYILILDEVMDVVEEVRDFTKDDLALIEKDNLAYIKDDYLLWNEEKLDYNGRYNDIKEMALNRNLMCLDGKLLYWSFPVDIFDYFSEVYILTYMFDGQIQKYYYDFFQIPYEKYQIHEGQLVKYSSELEKARIQEISKLINLHEGNLNLIGESQYALSYNWFKKDDGTLSGLLSKNLYNWFNNINRQVPQKERLWTTFRPCKGKMQGKGYSKSFVSINMRATNKYINSSVLAYCVNRYVRPNISNFFINRNIEIDQDKYALSEMLQWIWRSQIRDNKPICLYIPSKRMRTLLTDYLNLEHSESHPD